MARGMTKAGYELIQAEIDRLWHEERPPVVREVQEAAALGDRSENAAYIYGKKRLRAIDSRMRYLKNKIVTCIPVELATQKATPYIRFGAIVVVEDEDGLRKTYRLVDKDESEPKIGRISVQSPVGRSLLGKEAGDSVVVRRPSGRMELKIIEVRYGAGPP
jgi:transcription elongation factor GreB